MAWYDDPDDAARHPWRTSALVFVVLFVFWSVFAYFGWANRSVAMSLLVGSGFGVAGLVGMWRWVRNRRLRREGRPSPVIGGRFGIDLVAMGAGAGIAVFGLTAGAADVVGSGALVFAFGLAWYLIKRSVRAR